LLLERSQRLSCDQGKTAAVKGADQKSHENSYRQANCCTNSWPHENTKQRTVTNADVETDLHTDTPTHRLPDDTLSDHKQALVQALGDAYAPPYLQANRPPDKEPHQEANSSTHARPDKASDTKANECSQSQTFRKPHLY
jgi:hypothetical protein